MISQDAGICAKGDHRLVLEATTNEELQNILLQYQDQTAFLDTLAFSGNQLVLALADDDTKDLFVKVLKKSSSVIMARSSPAEKAMLVEISREILGFKVGALGDGYNDTPMLLAADVGIRVDDSE